MEIIDDYWELLPRYQGKAIKDLQFQRILYGIKIYCIQLL